MKHTLTATLAAALITLTGCSNGETEATDATPSPSIEPALKTAEDLQPNPDGHEIQIMFQWIPEAEDTQPAEARYYISTSEQSDTEYAYVTPFMEYDVMPSMDSGQWETYVYEVPDGGHASGDGRVREFPAPGRVACLALEMKQQVVLDYQESQVGEESVACYAFTDDNHDYEPGTPPVDVEFN